jgi:sporulation protein YlmC with PRC-barrel domain
MVPQGIIVDDHDRLSDPEELIRLKDILELEFELLGKSVVTVSKTRLGKVNDFAADSTSLYVQKLYVGQSLLKSFNGGQLSIDRTSIVEITNRHIKVEEIQKPVRAGLTAKITPSTQPS